MSATRDWDASTYDRVSDPQFNWGLEVLDRLPLRGDEAVLDAGCGSGRLTRVILERVPRGRVVAVDGSASMVELAREALPEAEVLQSDLSELELDQPVDAIFSNAVLHWIPDHDVLFRRLHAALAPGGRLVAQCGGYGNIARFRALSDEVSAEPPFKPYLEGWTGPWYYATPEDTQASLEAAGFTDIRCCLETKTLTPPEPKEFLSTVVLGPHLDRLPEELREPYVDSVLDRSTEPLVMLDYIRLNIDARRPA